MPKGTAGTAEGGNLQMQAQSQVQQTGPLHADQQMQADPEYLEEVERLRQEMEAQRQRRQQRELRTQQIIQQSRIIMPQKTIVNRSLPQVSTEIKSAAKRRTRAKMPLSALRRKRLNAEQVENAREQWNEALKKRKLAAEVDLGAMSFLEQNAIYQFLTEDDNQNRYMLNNINNGPHFEARVGQECFRQFMDLDLNLDLSDDTTFAAQSLRMEEISGKTEAMKLLMNTRPDFLSNLTEDEKEDLNTKLDIASKVSSYYQIQRKVITNPYYRTHYQKEISVRYNEGDTLEQKNLVILQQQAEYCRTRETLAGVDEQRKMLEFTERRMEGENTEEERQFFQRHMSQVEYGKNNTAIEDSVHAEFFRQHNQPGDPVYERLSHGNYRVSGMDVEMSESFVRHLSNLPRWKVVQNTPLPQIDAMIQNLVRQPAADADPAQVEECKQSNLEGIRQFKELMRRQMGYLKRKYGNGFLLLSPREIEQHTAEFENDFTNMQGLSELISYMKKLPGMFREDDPFDRELERLVSFFQNGCMAEGMARNFFAGDPGGVPTYADYKLRAACLSVTSQATVQQEIEMSDSMHLDIRWDTGFEISFEDIKGHLLGLNVSRLRDELSRLYSPEQASRLSWEMLFIETRGKSRRQLAQDMVDKGMEEVIRQNRQQWREGGFSFGGITYPGLGTDDFVTLNDLYRRIGADETIQAQYGITTPEIQAEFQDFLRQCEDAGEAIRTTEAYADKAIEMRDGLYRDSRGSNHVTVALCRQLAEDIGRVADRYIEQNRQYRTGEGSDIFTRFIQFRERIGMWTFPEHKEVMENTVEPEIARQAPEVSLTISGIEARTFDGPAAEELRGKKLKEGADPEGFRQALAEYNQEYARFRVLKRIVDAGETDSGQESEPLWHAVAHKRGFFQFDVYNRLSTCYNRWNAVLNRMKDMTE